MQSPKAPSRFPGQKADGSSKAISNIPINVPLRFVGRDKDLAAIDVALESKNGRAAITALHGLRGVAKTVERGCTQSSLRMRRTGAIAARVEITVWSKEVGADFLIARTGRTKELDAALSLSELLGGLPLAHEQSRKVLDDPTAAPEQYHNGLTVSKTFALAINEARRLHSDAFRLLRHVSLLAPELIPLFFFSDGREALGEQYPILKK